jgi:hypothetical protein
MQNSDLSDLSKFNLRNKYISCSDFGAKERVAKCRRQ